MKKVRMNISHSRFIFFKLKIFGEIVTTINNCLIRSRSSAKARQYDRFWQQILSHSKAKNITKAGLTYKTDYFTRVMSPMTLLWIRIAVLAESFIFFVERCIP